MNVQPAHLNVSNAVLFRPVPYVTLLELRGSWLIPPVPVPLAITTLPLATIPVLCANIPVKVAVH